MQVRLLGMLEVVDDDQAVVPLSGAKLKTVTALLALEAGRVVGTDRLIDAIYGERLPQRADNALQLLISKLRQALKRGRGLERAVLTRAPGYVLDVDTEDVDALRFCRLVTRGRASVAEGRPDEASVFLRQALGLWRGPALADFAFDDFATGERVRLEELRLSALEECLEVDLELGRHVECAGELEQLVAAHPLRERPWGQLMVALYRSGRQAEALRAFQAARRHLGDELGIEPGPELCRLEAAVLAHDPSLLGPDRPARAGGPQMVSRGNLATPLTACLGREAELAAISKMLESQRLVTLVGPGGIGKTRLAVEVALTGREHVEGRAWLVELASVSDGAGVLPALRMALGGPPEAATVEGLAAALAERRLLIVLDNCEHVVLEAARTAQDLVTRCPNLRVLATSREGLGVPGEVLFHVPPLGQKAAVRLFAERALAAAPEVHFDEPSAVAVADICARLDGLPLAIELAASRARALDVTQIATRLNRRFHLLTDGSRTALPRQRTLQAVVDWSYDLLTTPERLVFERLSVFSNGATLDAVEAVCSGDGVKEADVADTVSRLVDKSLLSFAHSRSPRYSMLQTLAEYGADRLVASGQVDTIRRRHATWVLDVVRGAERGAGTPPRLTIGVLAAENDNVDSALAWCSVTEPSLAFELAARMGWFWFWTGRVDVGWRVLSGCLESPVDVPEDLHARACAWAGMLGSLMQADQGPSLVEAAVAQARRCGHAASLGIALGVRAGLAVIQAQPGLALPDLDEAAACYEEAGDLWSLGMIGMLTGVAAMTEGRFGDAEEAYRLSIDRFRAMGDEWGAGVSLQRMAEMAERQGRFDEAATALEQAVASAGEVPNRFYQGLTLAQLASARLGQGRLEEAAALADEAVGRGAGQNHAVAIAVANHVRGRIAVRQGRYNDARPDLEVALGRYRDQGNLAAASKCLGDLGRVAAASGDGSAAVRLHAQAVEAAGHTADLMVTLAAFEGLAHALADAGEGARAALALGAADALRDRGTLPWDPSVNDRSAATSSATALLGVDELERIRMAGRSAASEEIVAGLLA